ncbi:hypothetical protein [Klebsiella aerogenes]|uniref:hypothetical protein n=1 Tax=Klebsiella aerogenes TaxID=548 RepID=UPI002892B569|nr:hypothetical protein [Klebsiella aerogenes]
MKESQVNVIIHLVEKYRGTCQKTPRYVITEPLTNNSGDICSWSMVLYFDNISSEFAFGRACFLVESAPSELLVKGFSVNIYQGPNLIGVVSVI